MSSDMNFRDSYEKALHKMGFGRFQKKIVLLLTLSTIPNGYFAMIVVFIARTPYHECYFPDLNDNGSIKVSPDVTPGSRLIMETTTASRFHWKNRTESDKMNCIGPSNYSIYNESVAYTDSRVKSCPFGVKYDFEPGRSSIVTEWDLVCENSWILPLVFAMYMTGVLMGSIVSGILADRYGRRLIFHLGTFLMFIWLTLCGVSTSPAMLGIFTFFAGAFGFINCATGVIIVTEVVHAKNRVLSCTLTVGGSAFGYMLLPLFAYFIPSWRTLCLTLGAMGIIYIPYIWLIPESPRWLLNKERITEFIKLFRKMASENNCTPELIDSMIAELCDRKDDRGASKLLLPGKNQPDSANEISHSRHEFKYLDLLRLKAIRSRTVVMWFVWFVCSVVYYGLSFNTSNIGGDPYINCFVAAAVEIPAYAMVILLLKYQGRKTILIGSLAIAGLTCTCVPFLAKSSNTASIVFAMIGKFAVSGSFVIVYIVCQELFPTLLRGMSLGSSSAAARVGGIVTPYLLYLGTFYYSAPYIVMGVLAVLSCLCVLILPETKDSNLPDTINDIVPKCQKPIQIMTKESEMLC